MSVLKVNQIQTANGVIIANLNSSGANTGFQLAPTLAPAFGVYMSGNQSIGSTGNSKVAFDTKTFDTNNNYDNTTNYRFTPTVAGYYQVNAILAHRFVTADNKLDPNIRKAKTFLDSLIYTSKKGGRQFIIQNDRIIYKDGETTYDKIPGGEIAPYLNIYSKNINNDNKRTSLKAVQYAIDYENIEESPIDFDLAAKEIGKPYEQCRLVIMHCGGGVTVGAHINGKVVDVNNGLEAEGPIPANFIFSCLLRQH